MRARQTAAFNAGSVAITGGAINGATIGATTPSSGAFTTLTSTGLNTHSNAVAVGNTPVTTTSVLVNRDFTGGTNIIGVGVRPTVQTDNTNTARLFYTAPNTVASGFTLTSLQHFRADQGTIGSGSAVNNQFAFYAHSSLVGATNNYGFYSDIASAAGRWNFFANGTANNLFAGNTRIGSTAAPTVALDVTGAAKVSGLLTPTGGIVGVTDASEATAGNVGEYMSATLAVGSATSLVTATAKTVISLSLTAGDWDVSGVINFIPAGSTNTTLLLYGTSTTDNAIGADNTYGANAFVASGNTTTAGHYRKNSPGMRVNIATTTTVYLIAQATFTVSTMSAYGTIRARRMR